MERCGSVASADAMATTSNPAYANITTDMAIQTDSAPCGTNPPSSVRWAKPVASVSGRPKKTRSAAHRMKAQSAVTLIVDSQNSVVPKDFTLMMLTASTTAAIARMAADIGTPGHHQRM